MSNVYTILVGDTAGLLTPRRTRKR